MKENQKLSWYLPPEIVAIQQKRSICTASNMTSGVIDETITIKDEVDF